MWEHVFKSMCVFAGLTWSLRLTIDIPTFILLLPGFFLSLFYNISILCYCSHLALSLGW